MKARKVVAYCLAGLVAGCVPIVSLNPLFTKETIVFDENLLGTWLPDANGPSMSLEFARFEERSAQDLPKELQSESKRVYRLHLFEGNRKHVLVACLVKLGERRFLDIFPDQSESDRENRKLGSYESFFLPCHMFMRVDAIGDEVNVHPMNDEGVKKLVEAKPRAVAYATTEEGPVLTASTKELQAFVTKYADDKWLFALEGTFVRKAR
jgi:hypothetical protein